MFVCSVQIISRLESQSTESEFQMFTLFSGRHIGASPGSVEGLCKFLRNISTNVCSLRKRTNPKKCLLYLFHIGSHFFLILPMNGFRLMFLVRDSENDL